MKLTQLPTHQSGETLLQSSDHMTISDRPSRLIRLPEVMARVGLKRSTIYRKMEEGTFPRSRSISAKCAVWVEAEIQGWIDEIARGHRSILDCNRAGRRCQKDG